MIKVPERLKRFRFIVTKEKIPIEEEWQSKNNYSFSEEPFQNHLKCNNTYGILCGVGSFDTDPKKLIVIDFDSKDIQEELEGELPSTFTVKTAGKGLHHLYYLTNTPETIRYLDENKKTLADIQGKGTQVIGANSILSTGNMYEVVKDTPLAEITIDEIKRVFKKYEKKGENVAPKGKIRENTDEITKIIKEKIPIRQILNNLGINTKKNPTECPFHDSVNGKCFSFTDQLWHCFHCLESGDIFTIFQKIYSCDFQTAKNKLKEMLPKSEKNDIALKSDIEEYENINVLKFKIYKNKEETIYKLHTTSFEIDLSPDTILNCSEFRKRYFNETGVLLPYITNTKWGGLVNKWTSEKGIMIEDMFPENTNTMIIESIINEIKGFAVVTESKEAVSFGRMYYDNTQPDYFFVCNKNIYLILKKNNFNITMSKVRYLMDFCIEGTSQVFRTGRSTNRFIKIKREFLPEIEVKELIKNDTEKDD